MTVSPEDTVTVSYLGYDDYRFIAGNASTFRIVLQKSAATMLDETVVIGYGKTTKKEVTGSVTSLKSADFDLGSHTDATAMLQGKVAGLTITNPDGGDPNGSYEILLRGTNTLMAGQGPLIIIDGVVDADIRNINFQEVESIDVLKVKYHKNTEQNTAKIPNEIPQKSGFNYHKKHELAIQFAENVYLCH